jgi:hypothetical protein
MPHMLYNPDDEDFVEGALFFCEHITGCAECTAEANTDFGKKVVTKMFKYLNDISLVDIPHGDYATAGDFCRGWLNTHYLLKLLIIGETDGTTVQ